jgi:hypothetical protein
MAVPRRIEGAPAEIHRYPEWGIWELPVKCNLDGILLPENATSLQKGNG